VKTISKICRGLGFRQGTVARCWSTASSPVASSALLTVCLPSADTSPSAALFSTAIITVPARNPLWILTGAIVAIVVLIAVLIGLWCVKLLLQDINEWKRIRREKLADRERVEASNKKHHKGGTHE